MICSVTSDPATTPFGSIPASDTDVQSHAESIQQLLSGPSEAVLHCWSLELMPPVAKAAVSGDLLAMAWGS